MGYWGVDAYGLLGLGRAGGQGGVRPGLALKGLGVGVGHDAWLALGLVGLRARDVRDCLS